MERFQEPKEVDICSKTVFAGPELTVTVTACLRLAHDKACQNPSTDRGGPHEVSPLPEDPLAIGGY